MVFECLQGLDGEEGDTQPALGTPSPVTPLPPQQQEQAPMAVALPLQLSSREVEELQEAVQRHVPAEGTAAERLIALCTFLLQVRCMAVVQLSMHRLVRLHIESACNSSAAEQWWMHTR